MKNKFLKNISVFLVIGFLVIPLFIQTANVTNWVEGQEVQNNFALSPEAQYWMDILNDSERLAKFQDSNLVNQERERARLREDFLKANSRNALSQEHTVRRLKQRYADRLTELEKNR